MSEVAVLVSGMVKMMWSRSDYLGADSNIGFRWKSTWPPKDCHLLSYFSFPLPSYTKTCSLYSTITQFVPLYGPNSKFLSSTLRETPLSCLPIP